MTVDLDRAFDELRYRAGTVTLPDAAELRQRSDRRRRGRLAAGMAVAAAMVAVLAVSASVTGILGSGRVVTPGPTPTTTATPTAQPSPTSTPSAVPTAPPTGDGQPRDIVIDLPPGCEDGVVPVWPLTFAGDALPASTMLEGSDWGRCYGIYSDVAGYEVYQPDVSFPAPALCADFRPYPADEHRVAGRVRGYYGGPEIHGAERVTRYAPGQAEAFMDQVRQRVVECAVTTGETGPWYTRILDTGFAGDESMIIFRGTDPDSPDQSYPGFFQAVVRIGDTVLIVFPGFDLGGDRAYTIEMAEKAVAAL